MKMKPEELKMIARLRAADRRWPFVRWFYLLFGGGMFAIGTRLFLHTTEFAKEDPQIGIAVAIVNLPVIALAWCLSAIVLREAIHKWGGDPTRRILLKLVDEVRDEEASQHVVPGYASQARQP